MVALIGPNGAGKSTLVNTLAGIVRAGRGTVSRRGRLAHVPEGREVFADLTVDDNLRLGGWRNGRRGRDTVGDLRAPARSGAGAPPAGRDGSPAGSSRWSRSGGR